MKNYCIILFLLITFDCWAQDVNIKDSSKVIHISNHNHRSNALSAGIGVSDYYRNYYSVPSKFQKNNTTGFAPVYIKLEYGLSKNLSLTFNFNYDNFLYNYQQYYFGNGVTFIRFRNSNFSLYGGGLSMVYYLNHWIHMKNLETYITAGITLNRLQYSQYPQSDSTTSLTKHVAAPIIKMGCCYWLTPSHSAGLFIDLGYDQQSIGCIGLKCNVSSKRHLRL